MKSLAILVLCCAPAAVYAQAPPTVSDLGALGGCCSQAAVIDVNGAIAGQSTTASGDIHLFAWAWNVGMVDLGYAANTNILEYVTGINDKANVAGFKDFGPGIGFHAFEWIYGAGIRDLGTLPGGTLSHALAINNNGMVVGWSIVTAGFTNAFAWTEAGGMMNLGTLGGGYSQALLVNDKDMVVGISDIAFVNYQHAFAWTRAGGMIDIDTIYSPSSTPAALNNAGMVVGSFRDRLTGRSRAFTWTKDAGMIDLGLVPGMTDAWATGVNDFGMVAGYLADQYGREYAFAWTAADGFFSVASLTKTSSRATAVDNFGAVIGSAASPAAPHTGFVWSAVTGAIDLPPLPGYDDTTTPVGIDEHGMIAGYTGSGPKRATTWQMPYCPSGSGCETPFLEFYDAKIPYDGLPHDVPCSAVDSWGRGINGTCGVLYDGDPKPPVQAGTYRASAYFATLDPQFANVHVDTTLMITCVTPTITWAAPAAIQESAALNGLQLNATANVAGTFTYTPPAGTVLNAGAQTLNVTFVPSAANGNYCGTASASVPLTITPTPGAMNGTGTFGGTIISPYRFSFTAEEKPSGAESGSFSLIYGSSRFITTSITQVIFRYPQTVFPRVVTMKGTGTWNGAPASFTLTAADGGRSTDTMTVSIVDGSGRPILNASGPLTSGSIQ